MAVMCKFFGVSRRGYYAFIHRFDKLEKDAALAELIAQQWERSFRIYGYRRMWLWLKRQDIFRNPKTVLRIMKKYDRLTEIRRHKRWQQMGQQVHKYKNLLNREFHTVNLVLDTIRLAMRQEKKKVAAELQLHSDQGAQYASQAYFELTQTYGITQSMSRRGNPYDNAMAEKFFSILKTECIYRYKPATVSQAKEMSDRYIHFYNYERIQLKTGEAPLTRRLFA